MKNGVGMRMEKTSYPHAMDISIVKKQPQL